MKYMRIYINIRVGFILFIHMYMYMYIFQIQIFPKIWWVSCVGCLTKPAVYKTTEVGFFSAYMKYKHTLLYQRISSY